MQDMIWREGTPLREFMCPDTIDKPEHARAVVIGK